MADTNLEGIILEIEATTGKADKGFDKTVKNLEALKKAVNEINVDKLNRVGEIACTLDFTAEGLKDAGTGLKGMASSLNELSKVDTSKLNQMVKTIQQIGSVFTGIGSNNRISIKISGEGIEKTAEKLKDVETNANGAAKATEGLATAVNENLDASQIDDASAKVDNLKQTAEGAAGSFKNTTDSLKGMQSILGAAGFSKLGSSLSQIATAATPAVAAITAVVVVVKALVDGVKLAQEKFKEGFTKMADHVKSAASKIASAVSSIINKVREMANDFGSNLPNLSGLFDELGKKLASLARLGTFMLLRKGFTALFSTVGEGFNNLFLYSQMMGTQFHNAVNSMYTDIHYLGNAFITAFEPIFNFCAPAIDFLINKIVAAINAISQLFGALTGAKTFTRAKKVTMDYGAALDKTTGSQKKAKNAIKNTGEAAKKAAKEIRDATLGIDELNIISQKDNLDNLANKLKTPSADDLGGGGGISPGDMFEEVPIDDKWKNFADWLKEMWDKGDFYDLGRWLGEKLNEALLAIPWDKIKKTARKIGKVLATFLNGFIETPGLFRNIGMTLAQAINTAFELIDSFAWNFHWNSLGTAVMDAIEGALDYIDWAVIRSAIQNVAKGLVDFFNTIFSRGEVFRKAGAAIAKAINLAIEYAAIQIRGLKWDNIGTSIGQFLYIALTRIDLSQLTTALAELVNGLADALYRVFNETFKDGLLARNISTAINDFFKNLQWGNEEVYEDGATKIKVGIKGAFSKACGELSKFLSDTITGIDPKEIANAFYNLIDTIVSGVAAFVANLDFEEIGNNLVTSLNTFIDKLTAGGQLQVGAGAINNLIHGVAGLVRKVIEEVDWNKLVQELKLALSQIDWGEAFAVIFEAKMMFKYFKLQVFWELGKDIIKGIIEGIGQSLENLFTKGGEAGRNIVLGLLDGLGTLVSIQNPVLGLFIKIIEWVCRLFGIESPSKVFEGIGHNIILGFAQGITNFFSDCETAIKNWVSNIKEWFNGKELIDKFKGFGSDIVSGFKERVGNKYTEVKTNITSWASGVKEWFNGTQLKTDFETFANGIVQGFNNKVSSTHGQSRTGITTWVSKVKEWFQGGSDGINRKTWETYGGNIVDGFKNKISGYYTSSQGSITTWASSVKTWFTNNCSGAKFGEVAKDVVDGFKNGIGNLYTTCKDTITSWGSSIISWFKERLQSNSPSKAFIQIGEDTVKGYNIGVDKQEGSTKSKVQELAGKVASLFGDNMKTLKANMQTSWNSISQTYSTGLQNIKANCTNAWTDLQSQSRNAMTNISTSVKNSWTGISANFTASWTNIKNEAFTKWNELSQNFRTGFESTNLYTRNGWSTTKNEFNSSLNAIKNLTNTSWNTIKSTVSNAMTTMANTIREGWNTIKNTFVSGVSSIQQTMRSVDWHGLGSNVVSGLWTGIQNNWGNLISNLKNYCQQLYEAAKSSLQVHSPSKLFMELGAFVTQGLNIGIQSKEGETESTVRGLTSKVSNTFSSTLQGIKGNIQASWNNISQAYEAGLNGVKNNGSSSWNDLRNTTSSAMNNITNDVKNSCYGIQQNFTASNLALRSEAQTTWNELQSIYKLGFENILLYIRNGWASIKNEQTSAWNILRNLTQSGWNNEKAAFSNGMTTVQMTVRDGWNTIKSIFQSGVSSMVQTINGTNWYSLGSNVVSGLWRGIQDNWGGLISNLKNYCSQLYEQAKSALAVHSPSRLFMKLGAFLVEGLNLGITDNAASSMKVVQRWANSISSVDFTMATSLKIDDSKLKNYEPNYGKDFTSEALVQRISREVSTSGAVSATLNANGGLKSAFMEALTETGVVANMESTAEATKRQADKDEQTLVELDGRKVNAELERRNSANGYRFTPKPA